MANEEPTQEPSTPLNPGAVPDFRDPSTDAKAPVQPLVESTAPKSKRRRRWPYVLLGLGGLLVLLVLLGPTIASTGPVRSIVVGQINKYLLGHVEIADWSIGWTGGIKVSGIKVFDSDNRQVAQLDSATTQLSLVSAIRGKLPIGETIVSGGDASWTLYADGTSTLDRLIKPSPKEDKPESDLPELSGHIVLQNIRATITQQTADPKTSHIVKVVSLSGDVKITDINSPIEDKLDVSLAVDDGPTGTIGLSGKLGVIANHRVSMDAANIDQTVQLKDFDIASAKPFLPPTMIRELAGKVGGQIDLKIADGKSIALSGTVNGTGIALATAQFAPGETYPTKAMALVIPPTTVSLPNGLTKFDAGALKIGNGTTDQITFKTDQIAFGLAADAPLASLMALAKNEKVAAAGNIGQTFSADFAKLAAAMPQTLGLKPGVKVDSGHIEQSLVVAMSVGKAAPALSMKILDVKGSTEVADAAGKKSRQPIAVEPITIDFKADLFGGGFQSPDVRDLNLSLRSAFLTGDMTAKTLASLNGSIKGDLAKLKDQAGQFVAMDQVALQGTLEVSASSNGDPTKPTAANQVQLIAQIQNLQMSGLPGGKTIAEPMVWLQVDATILRDAAGDIERIGAPAFALLVGDKAAPTVDIAITASEAKVIAAADAKTSRRVDVSKFTITRGAIALKKLQAELGAFLPLPADMSIDGVAQLSGEGSYVNNAAAFDIKLAANDTGIVRTLSLATSGPVSAVRQPVDVIRGYTLTMEVAANYAPDAAGNAKCSVTKLNVTDNQGIISLSETGALAISLPKDGQPQASGGLKFGLDLAKVNDFLRKWSMTPAQIIATASGEQGDEMVRQGRIDATMNLSQNAGGIVAAIDGTIAGLTVGGSRPTDTALLSDETIKLTIRATAAGNLSVITVGQLDAVGNLLTVNAKAQIALRTGPAADAPAVPMLGMVKQASVTIVTPDLKKIQAILDALPKTASTVAMKAPMTVEPGQPLPIMLVAADKKLPPAAAAPAPAAPAAVAPPPKLAAGSATITLNITSDASQMLIVPNVQAKQVQLSVGPVVYPVGDVTLASKMAILSQPAGAPAAVAATQPSIVDTISEVRVTELAAAGLGSTVALKEPIVIKGLKDVQSLLAPPSTQNAVAGVATSTANVAGAISAGGPVEPLMKLMAFLGGKPATSPYAGTYSIDQKFATDKGQIKLDGGGLVSDFISRDALGKTQFSEKAVRLADNVIYDPSGKQSLNISRIAVAFESSHALNIEANGKLEDLKVERKIDYILANVTYDGEQLWKIIHPMLVDPGTPPEKDGYKDYVVKGKATRTFNVSGTYPAVDAAGAEVPFNVAIGNLIATGSLGLDVIEAEGLKIEKFELPIDLRGGVLRLADLSKPAGQQTPPPYPCNGGTINLGGITVDLTGETMTLNITPNTQLLNKVQSTPALSTAIGKMTGQPLLVNPDGTKGVVDLKIVECSGVPLGLAAKMHGPQNKGHAIVEYSLSGIQLGSQSWASMFKALSVNTNSLQGAIQNGRIEYTSGFVGQDATVVFGEQQYKSMRLYGNVRLSDGAMTPMTLLISSDWFGGDVGKYIKKGLPLTLKGNFTSPQYDLTASIAEAVKQNFLGGKSGDVGSLIDSLTGKKKDKDKKEK